jgi:hypothetical protein
VVERREAMSPAILNDALTAPQRQQGFTLCEADDHILELCYQGKPVAHFSQSSATVAEIRATAERIAKEQAS